MQLKYIIFILIIGLSLGSCKEKENNRIVNPLEKALSSQLPNIKSVMDSLEKHEIQIRFTQIDRRNDRVIFTDFDYQVNPNNYFYPASTVKFPVAVLALEKLNAIEGFDMHTRFFIEGDTLETTVAKEILKIFSVSDNEAYNRLFEFLGQNEINAQLKNKGLKNVRISHRLATSNSDDITTKPLLIYINDSTLQVRDKISNAEIIPLTLAGIKKGNAYYEDDVLIQEPFDFGLKNYYSIDAQHNVLKRVLFPEKFSEDQQFKIIPEQRSFLLKAMHTLPKELGYNSKEYYDSYVKFFLYGDSQKSIPSYLEIYNKVGYAYGTLTDCAYIKDTKNTIDFMITATILVNQNKIFNDNIYEYDTVGIPFLAELGRELYQQELQRLK